MPPDVDRSSAAPPQRSPAPPERSAAAAGSDEAQPQPKRRRMRPGDALPDEVSREEINQLLATADGELPAEAAAISSGRLTRMAVQLKRRRDANFDMRIRYSEEPSKYLHSEVDLDEEIKAFCGLAIHPELYSNFMATGALEVLVGLLHHKNTDICVSVFETLVELTDAEVLDELEDSVREAFVKALLRARLCQRSVDVLLLIDETASEDDSRAVSNVFTTIENLMEVGPTEICQALAEMPRFLSFLLQRLRSLPPSADHAAAGAAAAVAHLPAVAVDWNRCYAAEILGSLLSRSEEARKALVELQAADHLLRTIAEYRKRNPAGDLEAELVRNVFTCLGNLMLVAEHREAFGKAQGIELMLRMIRERVYCAPLALRLAAGALQDSPTNCEIFVREKGLPLLFALFMARGLPKEPNEVRKAEENVISALHSLCRHCTGTSAARLLCKFSEFECEKLERLLEQHTALSATVRSARAGRVASRELRAIDEGLGVDADEQLYMDLLDAGLFSLQLADVIVVRLANMGNRQTAEQVVKYIKLKGIDISAVQANVNEYCAGLGEAAAAEGRDLQRYAAALVGLCAAKSRRREEKEKAGV